MSRIQGLSYGNEKSLKYFKWEAIIAYILDGLLRKQCGNGLRTARQSTRRPDWGLMKQSKAKWREDWKGGEIF